jgi:hypothetical protein
VNDLSEGFELHRREAAESVLSASAVVGLLDPGDDREAEFVAGRPAPAVQDVLLQQAEERLHGGVVLAGADAAHRPAQLRLPQRSDVGVRAELAAAVGVHHGLDRAAQDQGVAQSR